MGKRNKPNLGKGNRKKLRQKRRNKKRREQRQANQDRKNKTPDVPEQPKQNLVEYVLNDLSTPDLIVQIPFPKQQPPSYWIQNYSGKTDTKTQSLSMNVYCTMNFTLERVNAIQPIKGWAKTSTLQVIPTAGKQLNAYYDRKHLKFFYDKDPKTGSYIFLADSADVVAHELGHAILDSIRPEFFNIASLEVWSFHEAFADIISVLTILGHQQVRDYIINNVNGNLRQTNVASKIGEHVGRVIYDTVGPSSGRIPDTLRDANNSFKYVNPTSLPNDATNDKLAAEPHSFGRILLGAMYDILVEIYNHKAKSMSQNDAMVQATNIMWDYVLYTSKIAPASVNFYKNFASSMILVDKARRNGYANMIYDIFLNRNILSIGTLSNKRFKDLKVIPTDVHDFDGNKMVHNKSCKCMKVCDGHQIMSQSVNPLYNVDVEVPGDSQYIFNTMGILENEICPSEYEMNEDLKYCLNMIDNFGEVSHSENTMFEVVDDKLTRTHFRGING